MHAQVGGDVTAAAWPSCPYRRYSNPRGKTVKPAWARPARAMHELFFENLRNPARDLRAGAMRQFPTGQHDSILNFSTKFTAVVVRTSLYKTLEVQL